MNIVHSFWTKPLFGKISQNEKSFGGWRHSRYHYMSWALSCLSFKKIYGSIKLVTDQKGKELLIDRLGLPYSEVEVELDCLNHYPEAVWAVGKLYTYSKQEKPFIHVDGDIFIWQPFENRLEQAELVGQHVDGEEGHYAFSLSLLENHGVPLPPEMKQDLEVHSKIQATNAGIIGGNNIEFFKEYSERAFWFIDKNLDKISPALIGSSYALIYEQFLYSVMARAKNIEIEHYIDDKEQNVLQLTNFMRKYGNNQYVHLFGDSKSEFESCRELEMQLLIEYPEYHKRIIDFLKGTHA